MRIPLRPVPVAACPGETVFVVAEHGGKVFYLSDIEEGWELDALTENGAIKDRGCNQYDLGALMWQLAGDPEKLG